MIGGMRQLLRRLRRGDAITEFMSVMVLLQFLLWGGGILYLSHGVAEAAATAYTMYGKQFFAGMQSYARSNVVSLLAGGSQTLSPNAIITAEPDLMIPSAAPYGAIPSVYVRNTGTTVSLYTVIPVENTIPLWQGIATDAVTRLGLAGGIVRNGWIVSPAGWHVSLASLGITAQMGDIVLRADYTQGS